MWELLIRMFQQLTLVFVTLGVQGNRSADGVFHSQGCCCFLSCLRHNKPATQASTLGNCLHCTAYSLMLESCPPLLLLSILCPLILAEHKSWMNALHTEFLLVYMMPPFPFSVPSYSSLCGARDPGPVLSEGNNLSYTPTLETSFPE
jgi:hypothetical protein